jgi:hypothetical protein
MPVLDPERATMPRSALRYRPLAADDQARPGTPVVRPRRSRPDTHTTAAPVAADELEENDQPRRRAPVRRKPSVPAHQGRRRHPLLWVVLGLLLASAIWIGSSQLVTWGTHELNTWRYGAFPTTQMDAVLDNSDTSVHPSHLLVLNLHGEIILEVFPHGDVSHLQSYIMTTLTGPGSEQAVVSMQLFDPYHTHKPDLIIHVGDMESLLINDQGSFRPPTPAERQQLLPLLQQENQ